MHYITRVHFGPLPFGDGLNLFKLPAHHCDASSPLHAALKAAASEIEARTEFKDPGLQRKTDCAESFTMHAFVHFHDLGRHENAAPKQVLYYQFNVALGREALETTTYEIMDPDRGQLHRSVTAVLKTK